VTHSKRDYSVDRRLLVVSGVALLVGVVSTLAAVALLALIHFFTNVFFYQRLSLADASPAQNALGIGVVLVPAIGGMLVGLMARYGSEKIRGHGIPEAMESILFGKSRMSARVALLKPVSSGIVIGSGGPFGAEGPIIMTGASLGSLLAQYLHLTATERKTLLVAGACAGMTAIFATPVAALLLAVELLLFELRPRSLLPVALACAMAGFLRKLVFDPGPLFPLHTEPVTTVAFISCVIAGISCGALASLLTLSLYKAEDYFHTLPVHWMWWPAIGGLIVGIGGYLEPRALGMGYDVIGDLLNGHLLVTAAVALLTVKAIIWVIALGSGTSGGVLAPLLMLGAGLGTLLAPYLPGGSPGLWTLVCMAGVLGSTLGTPLTAVIFAFGLTHDSEALLPVMLTTAVAYGLTALTMKRSIMTEKIARRGLHIFREYGVDPLERQHVSDLMSPDVIAIDGAMPVADALSRYCGDHDPYRAYPVTSAGRVLGMLDYPTLRKHECSAARCMDVLTPLHPEHMLLPGATARHAAGRMAQLEVECLPVVKDLASLRLIGTVSLRDLLKPSRSLIEEETFREKLR